jgi:hypothetical protein
MVIFYLKNFDKWESEEFDEIYGAPLEGLNKSKKSSLFFPVYFVIRRVSFCMTTFFLFDYVIIQLIVHYVLTMISIVYLTNFYPHEEELEFKLELMNECFTILAIDLCLFFTNLDSNRKR